MSVQPSTAGSRKQWAVRRISPLKGEAQVSWVSALPSSPAGLSAAWDLIPWRSVLLLYWVKLHLLSEALKQGMHALVCEGRLAAAALVLHVDGVVRAGHGAHGSRSPWELIEHREESNRKAVLESDCTAAKAARVSSCRSWPGVEHPSPLRPPPPPQRPGLKQPEPSEAAGAALPWRRTSSPPPPYLPALWSPVKEDKDGDLVMAHESQMRCHTATEYRVHFVLKDSSITDSKNSIYSRAGGTLFLLLFLYLLL